MVALVALSACGTTREARAGDDVSGTVVVLAASSLSEAFTTVAKAFEGAHPDVKVALTFDGSSTLAAALLQGAPGDVFASADEASVDKLATAGDTAGRPEAIATNELQIVVTAGNPLGITGLGDLSVDLALSLCQPEVPCGAYATKAFTQAGRPVPPAGREANVKAVLTKVQLGEADAGIVYRTDVLAAHGVEGIDLAPGERVRVTYPAVLLRGAANRRGGLAFLEFLRGSAAEAVLRDAGFGPP